jgi:Spy/CpxP family protein refolding chaperone
MTMKQTLIAAVAACALTAGAALAQPHGEWHHGGMEGMEILHSLNLTDAQKAQAKTIEKAAWAQAKPIMAEMRTTHEQMMNALLASGTVTADQLSPMVTQEEQYRAQLDQIHLNTVLQIRALLTPDQITQAAATHQKLEALHEQEHEVMEGAHADGGAE